MAIELDRQQPDFIGSVDAADIPAKGSDLENPYNAWKGVGLVLKDWNERSRQIDLDVNLSAQGKLDAKQKAVVEFEKKLSYLSSAVEPHEKKVAALEQELSGANVFKSSDPADAILAVERRNFFRTLDRGAGIALLHEAVKSGDADSQALIAAIVTAPAYMGLIPVEIRNALVAATVERRHPEKLAELERARKITSVARYGLTRASELLRGNLPKDVRDRFVRGSN